MTKKIYNIRYPHFKEMEVIPHEVIAENESFWIIEGPRSVYKEDNYWSENPKQILEDKIKKANESIARNKQLIDNL